MKKSFSFAIALVATALALVSCEQKIDSPLVGSWNARGTLYVADEDHYYDVLRCFFFIDNGHFQYNDYFYDGDGVATDEGYILEGTWTVDGDKLTLHKTQFGTCKGSERKYNSNFQPSDEVIKWRIDGHDLHLTRKDGNGKEYEEVFNDGKR